MSDEAIQAIQDLQQPDLTNNFVKLILHLLNTNKEKIELDETNKIDIDELANSIPTDSPRFTFYVYQHTHNGQDVRSNSSYSILYLWINSMILNIKCSL